MLEQGLRGGPLQVANRVLNPISGVISPLSGVITPLSGVITPLISRLNTRI